MSCNLRTDHGVTTKLSKEDANKATQKRLGTEKSEVSRVVHGIAVCIVVEVGEDVQSVGEARWRVLSS